jgi:hypothetical protein
LYLSLLNSGITKFFLYRIEPRYVKTIEAALRHYIEEKEDFKNGENSRSRIAKKINKLNRSHIFGGEGGNRWSLHSKNADLREDQEKVSQRFH